MHIGGLLVSYIYRVHLVRAAWGASECVWGSIGGLEGVWRGSGGGLEGVNRGGQMRGSRGGLEGVQRGSLTYMDNA
jgi:hypothetical protein